MSYNQATDGLQKSKLSNSFILLNSCSVLRLPIIQTLQTKAAFTNESALSLFKGDNSIFKQGTTHTQYTVYHNTILVTHSTILKKLQCTVSTCTVHFMAIIMGGAAVPPPHSYSPEFYQVIVIFKNRMVMFLRGGGGQTPH